MNRISLVFAAVLFWGAVYARAGVISYTESVIGSGSLDGQDFTNSQVTLTFIADPSTVYEPIYQIFVANAISATVQVDERYACRTVPSVRLPARILSGFWLQARQQAPVRIFWIRTIPPSAITMETFIGPITDSGAITGGAFATDSGFFQLTSIGGDVTFNAASPAPEPAAFFLMGFGLLGVSAIGFVRRS